MSSFIYLIAEGVTDVTLIPPRDVPDVLKPLFEFLLALVGEEAT